MVADAAYAMELGVAFEAAGCAVRTCSTINAGSEAITEDPFELLVMDRELPDGNGTLLFRFVRGFHWTTKLPVLVMCDAENFREGLTDVTLAPIAFSGPSASCEEVVVVAQQFLKPPSSERPSLARKSRGVATVTAGASRAAPVITSPKITAPTHLAAPPAQPSVSKIAAEPPKAPMSGLHKMTPPAIAPVTLNSGGTPPKGLGSTLHQYPISRASAPPPPAVTPVVPVASVPPKPSLSNPQRQSAHRVVPPPPPPPSAPLPPPPVSSAPPPVAPVTAAPSSGSAAPAGSASLSTSSTVSATPSAAAVSVAKAQPPAGAHFPPPPPPNAVGGFEPRNGTHTGPAASPPMGGPVASLMPAISPPVPVERPNPAEIDRVRRILCIDDSATYRQALKKMLTAEGYEVGVAVSGEEGIELLKRKPNVFDCILLDRMMPGLSGVETCVILKQSPEFRNIPVIMLTSTEKRDAIIEGLNAGADDYVVKSADPELLRSRVRSQLRRKAFEDENRSIREELHQREIASARDQAANRAKGVFLAVMSHEIRTPMNAILGMTDMVLKTELTAEQRDLLTSVMTSSESLLHLLNDILDFSKIEAGRLDLDPTDFRMRYAIGDVMNALAIQSATKGVELGFQVAADVPDSLFGDTDRLRQIIVNLIGNAIKFTQKGEVVLSVDLDKMHPDHCILHFAVRDTGIGIDPEKQKIIFQPFEQADGTITRRYGGTGLGLAICGSLVELMGGKIWLESTLGKGSTFHFTARFGLGESVEEGQSAATEGIRGTRVLVVDDNASQRSILDQMLTQFTCRVTAVENGPAALNAMERALNDGEPFEIALIDTDMPGMGGMALVEEIHKRPAHSRMSLVLMSQPVIGTNANRIKELNVATLRKPVKHSDLLDVIVVAVDSHSAHHGTVDRALLEAPAEAVAVPFKRTPATPLRLLLAEDNAVNRKFATLLLSKMGHTVEVATNGRQAVDMHNAGHYDAVLMDIQMPVMDGLEATQAIRTLESATGAGSRTPIIAMTAESLKGDRERCIAAGCDDYLTKPIRADLLEATLERLGKTKGPMSSGLFDLTPFEVTPPPLTTPAPRRVARPRAFVVDEALARAGGDEKLLREVAGMLLEDAPQQLKTLHEAHAKGDLPKLQQLAHGLQGAVANMGAASMATVLKNLSIGARDKRNDLLVPLLTQASHDWTQLENEIRTWIAGL